MSADGPAPSTKTPTALDATATLDALHSDRVVRWWQVTQFVELAGPDAITFLADLSTQAVERIEPGSHQLGLLLEPKAHIVASLDIHRAVEPRATWTDPKRGEEVTDVPRLLLETLPEHVAPLIAQLTKYRMRARVTIEPTELASVAIVGATALELPLDTLVNACGGCWSTRVGRDSDLPARSWIGDAAAAHELVKLLVEAGVPLADPTAFEAARIEAGTVSLHDLLAGRMPAEVGGVESAVALDAGCYIGQEPVVRLHYRGKANRTLRRIVADGPIVPASVDRSLADAPDPLELRRDDAALGARPVGRLTTWSELPDGTSVGFATLRRELVAGDLVRLAGSDLVLRVVDDAPQPQSDVRAT